MFGSRGDLIAAVRREAVTSFTRAQEEAVVVGDPTEDLLTLGRTYRHWALKFPALYGVMFGRAGTSALTDATAAPGSRRFPDESPRAMRPLRRRVRDCVAAGVFGDHPVDEICGSIRAGVHGWVTLETIQPVVPEVDADKAYDQHLRSLIAAWTPKGAAEN